MKHLIPILLAVIFVLALVPSTTQAIVTLNIYVEDSEGLQIPDAAVYVSDSYIGSTSSTGYISYTHPGTSSFDLRVTKSGYCNHTVTVQSSETSITITLLRDDIILTLNKDTVVRGDDFALTITGCPNTDYVLWVKGTSNLQTTEVPAIKDGQQGVSKDDSVTVDLANWRGFLAGQYQFSAANNVFADTPPTTVARPTADHYAMIGTNSEGKMAVGFSTTQATWDQVFTIRVERYGAVIPAVPSARPFIAPVPVIGLSGDWDEVKVRIETAPSPPTPTPTPTPTAAFTASPTTGAAPLTVQFTDQSNVSSNGWWGSYWQFGDGMTSKEQHPLHAYTTAGNYTVRLALVDSQGYVYDTTKTDYITVTAPPTSAPVAAFTATPTNGTPPLTILFTDKSTNNPTSWKWNYGTGETWTQFSTSKNPFYTFTTPGTYWIELTVTNDDGYSGIERKADYITIKNPTPSEEYDFITEWGSNGTGNGQFYRPMDIVVDSQGYVYIADSLNHRVQKFTSDGTFITTWGSEGSNNGQFKLPFGVAVDASGNVYVADTLNCRIQKFTSDGNFITTWGSEGSEDGQLKYPWGIAVDNAGKIYVADTENKRVQTFTSDGTFIAKWGIEGTNDGQFMHPKGLAVDASRNVYVADSSRIQKFTSEGFFIISWGGGGTGTALFSSPNGVAVDASGNVYVADSGNHRIQKFTSDGTFITTWGTSGSDNAQFALPNGVAVDVDGIVYVTDTYNHRIQTFRLVTPTPPPSTPIAAFTASPTTGIAPLTVQFTDQSTNSPTSWKWEYSTGGAWTQFSTSQHPSYQFTSAGTYSIRLTATNAGGTDTETKVDYIRATDPTVKELPEHNNVAENQRWRINFNRVFSQHEVDNMYIENAVMYSIQTTDTGVYISNINTVVEWLPEDKQAIITPLESYIPGETYYLRIDLSNDNRYKMKFTVHV